MTAGPAGVRTTDDAATRPSTLVWIDAREAVIVRWLDGRSRIERLESEVPPHHRATGHVRHDPAMRHGGGGRPQAAGEPHRLEHLARFVDQVAMRLPPDHDLLILGPGTVRERLRRLVRELDGHLARPRAITCEASPRLTDRQLVARLRDVAGADPRRRTVGAYSWRGSPGPRPSGSILPPPRRVVEKPRRRIERGAP